MHFVPEQRLDFIWQEQPPAHISFCSFERRRRRRRTINADDSVTSINTHDTLTHFSIRHSWVCEEAPGAYRPNGKQSQVLSSHDIIIIIIIIVIIVITGDAFNAISHDGVHFPAESELRSDEAVTTGTSNIKEPQGLFMAAFHRGSRSHDSSAALV